MRPDIVIPYHSKDQPILKWSVNGIRRHLDAGNIFVVAHRKCANEISANGAIFVDEESVVEGLSIHSHPSRRWGWYFQQILKLGMADHVTSEYYIVIDSDTVFLRPVSFFKEGKPFYTYATEHFPPYFEVFEKMLGFSAHREYSFVSHHMVMNCELIREMRSRFKEFQPWYLNIVKYVLPQKPWSCESQFSEYETYGHYLKKYHPQEVNMRHLKWSNSGDLPTQELIDRLAQESDYVSFQSYMRGSSH